MSVMNVTSSADKLQNHQIVTDIRALNDLKQTARENPNEALRAVAEQFEAIFVQQILKESRKVQLDGGWLEGGQSEFFQSWHDEQLSQSIAAQGSLGLADMIVEQLSANSLPASAEELETHKQKLADNKQQFLEPHKDGVHGKDDSSQMPMTTTTQDALSLRPLLQ